MTEPLTVQLQTLTPLWTGGVDGTSDRLHATGIIGSLRWWYEAIVRGLGGTACDPTEHPCSFDTEKYKNAAGLPQRERLLAAGLCDACQLFGATGWRRRFRLAIEDQTAEDGPNGTKQPTSNRFNKGGNQRPSWYFKGGRTGQMVLQIIPTAAYPDLILIPGTLSLIARWGGLAAKSQLGYGWVEIVTSPRLDTDEFVHRVPAGAGAKPGVNHGLPSLDKMFFTKLQVSEAGVAATLNVKYDLRAAFRKAFGGNQTLRHWVCGSVRGNQRQASKISVTQTVNGVLRVWGWIPEGIPVSNVTRDQVVDEVYGTLRSCGRLDCWREFNSARDTVSRQPDIATYLSELLKEGAS